MKSQLNLAALVLAWTLLPGPAQSQPASGTSAWVRVIVTFNGPIDTDVIVAAGGEVLFSLVPENSVAALLPGTAVVDLSLNIKVKAVTEDAAVSVPEADAAGVSVSTGSQYTLVQTVPWGISKVNAPAAWSLARGRGIKVAILDTGIDETHPDLAPNVVLGPSFVAGTETSHDDHWHGTSVAGVCGAVDNGIGVVGVAPDCTLVAVKVLDSTGSGYSSWIVQGINWCLENGVHVVNFSASSLSSDPALEQACDLAASSGVVVVAAAGNIASAPPANTNEPRFPALYRTVLSVGATDSQDRMWAQSVHALDADGEIINDVAAPGVRVISTYRDHFYAGVDGTSFAAPHAAGLAALLFARGYSSAEIRTVIEGTAVDIKDYGRDAWSGYGRIDCFGSVQNGTSPSTGSGIPSLPPARSVPLLDE